MGTRSLGRVVLAFILQRARAAAARPKVTQSAVGGDVVTRLFSLVAAPKDTLNEVFSDAARVKTGPLGSGHESVKLF